MHPGEESRERTRSRRARGGTHAPTRRGVQVQEPRRRSRSAPFTVPLPSRSPGPGVPHAPRSRPRSAPSTVPLPSRSPEGAAASTSHATVAPAVVTSESSRTTVST
ncbi:MAG: hypothetical protein ACK559_19445, partial [bacterium]